MNTSVIFTCHQCGLEDVRVIVRARNEKEDVVAWVTSAIEVCGAHHKRLSPECRSRHLDLAVPVPDNDLPIGTSATVKALTGTLMPSKAKSAP